MLSFPLSGEFAHAGSDAELTETIKQILPGVTPLPPGRCGLPPSLLIVEGIPLQCLHLLRRGRNIEHPAGRQHSPSLTPLLRLPSIHLSGLEMGGPEMREAALQET